MAVETTTQAAEGARLVEQNKADAAKLGITLPGSTYSPITSSSGSSRTEETKTGKAISELSAPAYASPGKNTQYIRDMEDAARTSFEVGNAQIDSQFNQARKETEAAQAKEVGSTSTSLARIGGYLGESASGQGAMLSLTAGHRADILSLESKRQQALAQARSAYGDKKFDIAKTALAEAKSYENEVYKRQQDFFGNQRLAAADARAAGLSSQSQESIYSAINGGAKTVDEIFSALGGKVSAEDIAGFVAKVKPKGYNANTFEFDQNDLVLLLGAGMGQDDIAEVQDYVSTNGYTDTFRKTLTARERGVLDSIYYPKAAKVSGAKLSIADAKALGLPTSIIGRSEEQIVADLNSPRPPSWYAEYVESTFADPGASATTEGLQPLWQNYRSEVLGQNAIENRKKTGGSSVDFNSIQ